MYRSEAFPLLAELTLPYQVRGDSTAVHTFCCGKERVLAKLDSFIALIFLIFRLTQTAAKINQRCLVTLQMGVNVTVSGFIFNLLTNRSMGRFTAQILTLTAQWYNV